MAVAGDLWNDFKKELERLQSLLTLHADPEINKLRIAKATVPALAAPEIHETGYGAIMVTKGKGFSALLTNGKTLTA